MRIIVPNYSSVIFVVQGQRVFYAVRDMIIFLT